MNMMRLMYNSPNYTIVVYPQWSAVEILDKAGHRGGTLRDELAAEFQRAIVEAARGRSEAEQFSLIDDFLDEHAEWLTQPVVLH